MRREPLLTVAMLRQLRFLPTASDRQLQALLSQMSLHRVPRRTLLFSESAPPTIVSLVVSGTVRLTRRDHAGKAALITVLCPGDLCGTTALLSGTPSVLCAEAASDCWVATWRLDVFGRVLLQAADADFPAVLGGILTPWLGLIDRYSQFQRIEVLPRLALALKELAHKCGVRDARGTILSAPLTHQDFADLVGAARQQITVHLKTLEQRDLILRQDGKLIVQQRLLESGIADLMTKED